METSEQCMKSVQSWHGNQDNVIDVVLVFLLLTLNVDFAQYSGTPIVDFEEVNACWEWWFNKKWRYFLDRYIVM